MKRVTSPLLGGSVFQRKTIKSSLTFLDAKREWGKPRQLLMGRGCVRNLRPHLVSPVGTPFGGTASPRPRCIANNRAGTYYT
ncbi:MAG: hypothetical protein F6J98_21670 [Moorea sp. SIO4G2]|nr:hypothetical protein [Moorena sp. SIO4G2]